MCLIVFGWDIHPKYKLILAANRDEFYSRPTNAAAFWEDHPQLLGGRDLQAGGSWMLVSRKGKLAAVTNYRDPANIQAYAASRGAIPTDYLTGEYSPKAYAEWLHENQHRYNGFNALIGDADMLVHYSNYEGKINQITPGIHGLSNALLNTRWPKVEKVKSGFRELISTPFSHADLLHLMSDTSTADSSDLPDTGVPPELEKALSAVCIRTENYGTRCTTVMTLDRNGRVAFTEKTHEPGATPGSRENNPVYFEFDIE